MPSVAGRNPAPLVPLAACMVLGIVLGQHLMLSPWWLIAGVAAAAMMHRWPLAQSVSLWLCMVLLGIVVGSGHRPIALGTPLSGECVIVSEPSERPKTIAVDVFLLKERQRLRCYVWKDERSSRLSVGDGLLIRTQMEPSNRCFVRRSEWHSILLPKEKLTRTDRARLYFLRLRHRLLTRYAEANISNEAYSVLAAMTLGDKSSLTPALRETYSATGSSHILAMSGLHLSVVYGLISICFAGSRRLFLLQVPLVLSLWAFAFLVGLAPSIVRAATMLTVYTLLSLGGRDRAPLNLLAFTAIAMLLVNPLTLFDVGFQLSFLSILGILLWMPLMESFFSTEWLQRHRLFRWLWSLLAVAVAAQIATAPVVAYYFGRLPVYFLLSSVIVIPSATLILYAALAFLLIPWNGTALLLQTLIEWLDSALAVIARLPMASIGSLHPTLLQVAGAYLVITAAYLLLVRLSRLHSLL